MMSGRFRINKSKILLQIAHVFLISFLKKDFRSISKLEYLRSQLEYI